MKKSSFRLNEEQESNLVDYLQQRFETLRSDNKDRIDADKLSWATYENDREDRDNVGIYAHSNTPVPLTALIVDHFVARAEEDLTGSPPYFKFDAQGPSDMGKAEDFDRYFNWKLGKRGKIREVLEEAHLQSFVQRAAILKSVYEEDVTRYVDYEAAALFDKEVGDFVEHPQLGMLVEGQAVFIGMPTEDGQGVQMVLEQDPSFVMQPDKHEFRKVEKGLEMEATRYKGPKGAIIDYDRIYIPSNARSIDDADCIIEMYDKPLTWVESMFLERDHQKWDDFEFTISNQDASQKTEDMRKEDAEQLGFDREEPKIAILEVWMRRDILEVGYPQEFVVFVDHKTWTPIFYEYTCNVTPDKRVPYVAVSVGRNRNRWWGKSVPERISVYQEYLDKQFNSQSYRNELSANPVTGANPHVLEEEPDDIEVEAGKVYHLKDGFTMKDFLSFSEIPQNDLKTQNLIDFVFGVVQLWLGVTNLAQGDYQALAPANTATGVEATLQEASKIGRRWMRRMIEGYEQYLTKLVKVGAATMDAEEVYEYMEGRIKAFATMSPERVQHMEVDASVEMAQNQNQRTIERSDLALKALERYFAYAPDLRPFAKPLLVKILEAMGYEDAEVYFPEGAPDVPRDEVGKPLETPPQLSGAVEGMGSSNSRGANQYQGGVQE